jgi:Ribbon-helix-helix domain
MGRTKRKVEVAYLDAEKLELLKQLAAQTRIARTVLVREAIDDLLIKYRLIKAPKPPPRSGRRRF